MGCDRTHCSLDTQPSVFHSTRTSHCNVTGFVQWLNGQPEFWNVLYRRQMRPIMSLVWHILCVVVYICISDILLVSNYDVHVTYFGLPLMVAAK